MRHEPVKADRHPVAGHEVHHEENRQIGPRNEAVPEQDDRRDGGREGDNDGGQVHALLKRCHGPDDMCTGASGLGCDPSIELVNLLI
jgi:hypothetical protein